MNQIKSTVPGYAVICRAYWCALARCWGSIGAHYYANAKGSK